jgi:hypothetical protein
MAKNHLLGSRVLRSDEAETMVETLAGSQSLLVAFSPDAKTVEVLNFKMMRPTDNANISQKYDEEGRRNIRALVTRNSYPGSMVIDGAGDVYMFEQNAERVLLFDHGKGWPLAIPLDDPRSIKVLNILDQNRSSSQATNPSNGLPRQRGTGIAHQDGYDVGHLNRKRPLINAYDYDDCTHHVSDGFSFNKHLTKYARHF